MATDAMPEQHVMDGARPRGGTTHVEDGTMKERSCNLDRNCPPWERPQDWTTRKFTKAYCEKLDKANNVTGIGTEFYLYPCRNPNYYDRDDRTRRLLPRQAAGWQGRRRELGKRLRDDGDPDETSEGARKAG